ncbi:GNAT family N-acetyltransferase [Streptomyces polyrhachis]|uniref:GNAT family N-acetyltransferase n=1 Tax=Streptomyces polyrhachis TaxID=1282885 RepID=A0ABW2GQ10_9ACTN
MSSLFIRPAEYSDEHELRDLDIRTWSPLHAVTPKPVGGGPPYDPFFDARHRPQEYLVAEADGRLAGYIRVAPPTSLASNAHVRQIQGLAVDDWARGRGAARGLLRAAGELARRQGAVRLTLRVLGHNLPARRLYESEGFTVEGVLPGEFWLEGQLVDDVLMARSLPV